MLQQETRPAAPCAPPPAAESQVLLRRVTPEGAATVAGAAAGALGLVWVLYERVLPFSGVLGFWLCWYAVFLALYAAMAALQWDTREVLHRVTTVAFVTGGVLTLVIVLVQVLYTLLRGSAAVRHLTFFVQSMAFAGPDNPLSIGGVLHAMIGTAEQIAPATPSGTENSVARAICSAVPSMACTTPPWVSGLSGPAKPIDWTQKLRWRTAEEPRSSV